MYSIELESEKRDVTEFSNKIPFYILYIYSEYILTALN